MTLIALGHNISGALQEKSTPHTKHGDYHLAFPLLEAAAEENPKETLYYYTWLLLYYYRDYERAIDRLNEYDDFTPGRSDVAWGEHVNYLKGLAYKQMGRYHEAVEEFSLVVDELDDQVDPYTLVYRGLCWAHLRDTVRAHENYHLALELEEQNAMAHYWLAESLATSDKARATHHYLQALEYVKKGYVLSDPYVSLFDMPTVGQIKDRLGQ